MKAILTVTPNPALDVHARVEVLVSRQKLRCRDVRRDPGGGGINVARAVKKLGGEAVAAYLAGGPVGRELEELLAAEQVTAWHMETGEITRESLVVTVEETGREYRFVLPGPPVKEKEVAGLLDFLAALSPVPDYIVGSGSIPPGCHADFYARVAHIASRGGARMVLDTSGEPLAAALEEGVYAVKPNRRELADFVGEPLDDEGAVEEAARSLVRTGTCEVVAVSLGADGALLATADGAVRRPAPEVEVRSDVGAGDSFVAGLVLGLAREWTVPEAFDFAMAAGAAALTTGGTELCSRGETERLYAGLRK